LDEEDCEDNGNASDESSDMSVVHEGGIGDSEDSDEGTSTIDSALTPHTSTAPRPLFACPSYRARLKKLLGHNSPRLY
jgi:hypothetical protein